MLALAGIPGTVGFIGKFQLIHALVAGDYTWLAIVLVVGSMISLGYYLRVVATMWMGPATTPQPAYPPIAGGSPEADATLAKPGLPAPDQSVPHPEVVLVAVLFGAASVFFGIFPEPLFHLASHAGHAISALVP
jgi:NADH-quinone oxidoreductase subunit N